MLVSTVNLAQLSGLELDAWLKVINAEEIVAEYQLSLRASRPDERWLLVRLRQ